MRARSRRIGARFVLAAIVCIALPALAQDDDEAAERTRIAAERREVEQRFAAAQAACRDRFAVTACIDQARAARREALAPLHEREMQLEDARRQRRADARRKAIEERHVQDRAASVAPAPPARAALAASSPPAGAAPAASSPLVLAAPSSASAPAVPAPAASARHRRDNAAADEAGRRAAAAQQRRDAAAAEREKIARREADRAGRGQRSAPLPVPPAASR